MKIPPKVTRNVTSRKVQSESPPIAPESSPRIKLCQIPSDNSMGVSPSGEMLNNQIKAPDMDTTNKDRIANREIMAMGPALIRLSNL